MRVARWFFLSLVLAIFCGCAGPSTHVENAADETSAGRKLYILKCAKFHKLYNPAKYSDEEWGKWMIKMSRKAKLNSEQSQLISQYVDTTLRGGNKSNPR